MSERPRILDDLGVELDRAVRADAARRPAPRFRWQRGPLLALLVALGAGGVAVAGTQLLGEGEPLPSPRAADVDPGAAPQPGTGRLVGAVAQDPAGGRPWRMRISRTATGDFCTALGQTVDGRFGIVGLDRIFRATPLGAAETCSQPARGGRVVAGARVFIGGDGPQGRTLVAGIAGPDVRALRLSWRGGSRALPLGADRAFVTALAGYPEDLRPVLRIATGDGERSLAFADTGRNEVADIDGGNPWAISGGPYGGAKARRALMCAQALRPRVASQRDGGFEESTPVRCGYPARTQGFSAARRFVPSATPGDGFWWGPNPAKTLVYGGVSESVVQVEVRGPGGLVRRPRIFRPSGAFLVLLDGHVDPRGLRTVLTLRGGKTRTLDDDAALGTSGRAIRSVAPPPWRSVASQRRKVPRGLAVPVASTLRASAPVADPAGGPDWGLQTFRGTVAKGVGFAPGAPQPTGFQCFLAGPLVAGELRRASSGRPGPKLDPTSEGDAFCNDDRRPRSLAAQVIAYSGDLDTYDVGLSRIVVSGQVPRARKVELLGLGAARSLPLTGDGAFLTLLRGNARARLRLRATFPDGRVIEGSPRGADLSRGAGEVDARTSDPDGTAPWAATTTTATDPRLGRCLRYGRLVLDRFAFISPDDGSVRFGDAGSACVPAAGLPRDRPVLLVAQPFPAAPGAGLSPAQVQRRTRSGRTLIAGTTRPDVAEIELQTPRDVRLVRPRGPGNTFVAVYDGVFTGGRIVLRVRFTDGRTTTISQRAGGY